MSSARSAHDLTASEAADATGFDWREEGLKMEGRIDPWAAHTPSEFVVLLRRAAAQATSAKVERLAARLDGNDLPAEDLVLDLLKACDMDIAQEDRWMRVYDQLAGTDERPPPSSPPQRHPLGPRHATPVQWTGGKTTAAVGLALTGIFALFGHVDLDGAPATVSAQPPTNETRDPVPSLEPSLEPSTAPSSPQATHITTGRHTHGTVTLGAGQAWDFDAGSSTADVLWADGALQSADFAKRLRLMPSGPTPDSQDCSKLKPGWLDRAISGLTAGQSLCVRTTDGHWVWISVTTTGPSIHFTYTTQA